MVGIVMVPDGPRPDDIRYRDLLARLRDLEERVEQIERDQRAVVGLLRDFRDLARLLVDRLKQLDREVAGIAARVIPFYERTARHFRN
jgi:hypothetical protein